MNNQKMREFMYFLFDRYASGHEPTVQQYENALADYMRQQLPKRTTVISNQDQRFNPINIVVK